MGLRKQLSGFTVMLLSILILSLASVAVVSIVKKGREDVAKFEREQYKQIRGRLKDLVEIALTMVDQRYEQMENQSWLAGYIREEMIKGDSLTMTWSNMQLLDTYGNLAREKLTQDLLDEVSKLRYDGGNGYFWITNDRLPYPTMVMHAAKPQNNGKVMSDEKYNVEKKEGRNIYSYRVRLSRMNADTAYIEYTMNKPGEEKVYTKMSYSYWYEPFGWVISTGIYTDQVQEEVIAYQAGVDEQLRRTMVIFFGTAGVLLLLGALLSMRFGRRLSKAVVAVQERLKRLSLGQEVEAVPIVRSDELGDMSKSLNDLLGGVKSYTEFAKAIGEGELETSFTPLSEEDVLGQALLEMRESLAESREQRRIQTWLAEGTARFGELLNQNSQNLDSLTHVVLQEMIKYLNVNQGALYLVEGRENNDEHLRQVAAYAYNRQKKANQRINPGEGLNGQCMLERETLYITDIPKDFVNITSGLGNANPRCVVIFPIHNNEDFFGTIEMASFNLLQPHELTFMEKTSELLANALHTARANQTTSELLAKTQNMTEELRAQEEELRQNQEELQATHEEMRRKQQDLEVQNTDLIRKCDALEAQNRELAIKLEIIESSENAA